MKRLPVEQFARKLAETTTDSVRAASVQKTQARVPTLVHSFSDLEAARSQAAQIKADVLDRLFELQRELIANCEANGIRVHHAADAAAANRIVLDICRRVAPQGGTVVKAKSMATEEIHLNRHLEDAGYSPIETDLGEYVVQLDGDTPSHIVTPIIHKNRKEIARSFEREGLGPYTEVPEELAMQARARLRAEFQQAAVGISGVNFAIASTGRIVLVENEGNNRLSTTAPEVHIAVMGIEKMLPSEADLPLFLKLLAGSATGQKLTTYTHLISGPRRADELDGPSEVHLVLLDNGRSRVLEGPYRDSLKCIRCGACLNICPVYRQATGHAYGHVYSGPIGAVLAPALEGVERHGHLAKASTLCGACEEVCPVKIPIPHMLLKLRDESRRLGAVKDPAPWSLYAFGARHPGLWRTGLKLLPVASAVPHPMKTGWQEFHEMPRRVGRSFRDWWQANRTEATAAPSIDAAAGKSPPADADNSVPEDLWKEFALRLEGLGGELVGVDALELNGLTCYLDSDVQGFPAANLTDNVWQADIGVTTALFAIAETGSIVVSAGDGHARLASLAPPVHVALVKEIVGTLDEAIARMDSRTHVVITGTSRTADIEGVLVRGVHGPRNLFVVRR